MCLASGGPPGWAVDTVVVRSLGPSALMGLHLMAWPSDGPSSGYVTCARPQRSILTCNVGGDGVLCPIRSLWA